MQNETPKKINLKPGRDKMFCLGLPIKKRYQNYLKKPKKTTKKQKHLREGQNVEAWECGLGFGTNKGDSHAALCGQ